jgi:pilus assembly protein CpaC
MTTRVHGGTRPRLVLLCFLAAVLLPLPAAAQLVDVITVARGTSTVLPQVTPVQRVAIGDPAVADAAVISPREILLTAKAVGTTSLIVWDANNVRRLYNVEVGVDAGQLERQIRALFPNEQIRVTATGNTVILSGHVTTGISARRALDLAAASGATVIDNLTSPPAAQVLLQVRIAEVNRSVLRVWDPRWFVANPEDLTTRPEAWSIESLGQGLLRLFLLDRTGEIDLLIRNLRQTGQLQMLAEPNLLALDGHEATFLAGGEFPYPSVSTGANAITTTVAFKEFGVRLTFRPTLTGAGNIRLLVAPEVSSLDFANSVQISGFTLPALRTRRASTEVELRPGQTFAIAGLMDNSLARNVSKVPVLGDLPILGLLFRSTNYQQNRSELVVMVTPTLVEPMDVRPPIPPGEPEQWRWDRSLRDMPGTVPPRQP